MEQNDHYDNLHISKNLFENMLILSQKRSSLYYNIVVFIVYMILLCQLFILYGCKDFIKNINSGDCISNEISFSMLYFSGGLLGWLFSFMYLKEISKKLCLIILLLATIIGYFLLYFHINNCFILNLVIVLLNFCLIICFRIFSIYLLELILKKRMNLNELFNCLLPLSGILIVLLDKEFNENWFTVMILINIIFILVVVGFFHESLYHYFECKQFQNLIVSLEIISRINNSRNEFMDFMMNILPIQTSITDILSNKYIDHDIGNKNIELLNKVPILHDESNFSILISGHDKLLTTNDSIKYEQEIDYEDLNYSNENKNFQSLFLEAKKDIKKEALLYSNFIYKDKNVKNSNDKNFLLEKDLDKNTSFTIFTLIRTIKKRETRHTLVLKIVCEITYYGMYLVCQFLFFQMKLSNKTVILIYVVEIIVSLVTYKFEKGTTSFSLKSLAILLSLLTITLLGVVMKDWIYLIFLRLLLSIFKVLYDLLFEDYLIDNEKDRFNFTSKIVSNLILLIFSISMDIFLLLNFIVIILSIAYIIKRENLLTDQLSKKIKKQLINYF